MEVAGANRRWRCQFRCRGSRRESAVALSQYLAKLKDDEQLGLPPFMDRQDILFGMVMTHARLAHLYQMSGQTNLSAQETAEALRCAKMSGKFLWVTNQAMLARFVARGGIRTVKP